MSRKQYFIIVIVGTLAFVGAAFYSYQRTTAIGFFNFGGRITVVTPCTCTPGAAVVVVSNPRPATVLYVTGASKLYKQYQVRPGPWTVGNYIPGPAVCLQYAGKTCIPNPVQATGVVQLMGTSL